MSETDDLDTAREEISQKLSEYLRETPPAEQSVAGFAAFLAKG